MTTMWTTSQRPRGWPVHGFQSRMLAILLGMTTTIGVWYLQPKYEWTAIERHYLMPYMLVSAGWFEKYAVLHTIDAKGKSHPATPEEVEPVDMTNAKRGAIPFRLTEAAREEGEVIIPASANDIRNAKLLYP